MHPQCKQLIILLIRRPCYQHDRLLYSATIRPMHPLSKHLICLLLGNPVCNAPAVCTAVLARNAGNDSAVKALDLPMLDEPYWQHRRPLTILLARNAITASAFKRLAFSNIARAPFARESNHLLYYYLAMQSMHRRSNQINRLLLDEACWTHSRQTYYFVRTH